MSNTVSNSTLERAFSGLVRDKSKEAFVTTGADYRTYKRQNTGWVPVTMREVANFFVDLVAPLCRSLDFQQQKSGKSSALEADFQSVASAILKASADAGAGTKISFSVGGDQFRLEPSGDYLVLRDADDAQIKLNFDLSTLKSALLRAYIADLRKDNRYQPISFAGFDLSHTDLFDLDLSECDFSGARMHNAAFIGCTLCSATFIRTDLTNSVFRDCDMDSADFTHAELVGVYLRDSTIAATEFRCANFASAVFVSVDASKANVEEVLLSYVPESHEPHTFPDRETVPAGTRSAHVRPHVFDPKEKAGLIVMLEQLASKIYMEYGDVNQVDRECDATFCRLLLLLEKSGDSPSVEAWAKISIGLEKILRIERSDDYLINGLKWGFIKKGIAYLEMLSRLNWSKIAHDRVVDDLADHYDRLFDFAHSSYNSVTVSTKVTLFSVLSFALGYNWKKGTTVDDECYPGKLELHSVEGGANLCNPGGDLAKFGAQVGGSISGSTGSYKEWAHGRHFVEDQFAELVTAQQYLARKLLNLPPEDSYCRFLNRAATICGGLNQADRTPEVANFGDLLDRYDRQKKDIAHYFTLLGTIQKTANSRTLQRKVQRGAADYTARHSGRSIVDRPQMESMALGKHSSKAVAPFHGTLTAFGAKSEAALGSLGTFDVAGGKANLTPSIGLSREYHEMSLDFAAYQSAIEQVQGLFERYQIDGDPRIRHDIDDFHQGFAHAASAIIKKLEQIWSATPRFNSIYGKNRAGCRDFLEQDFAEYCRFQKQLYLGDAASKASIEAFHQRYGVNTAEEFISCLYVLNAHLFIGQIKDRLYDQSAAAAAESEACREFERKLMAPPFSCDHKKIKEMCFTKKSGRFSQEDEVFKFSISLPLEIFGEKPGIATAAITLLKRKREHHNLLRAGTYYDISIDAGFELHPKLMKFIAVALKERAELGEVSTLLDADLSDTHTAPGLTLTRRYYRPKAFAGIGAVHMFDKVVERREYGVALNSPPIGAGPATVGIGIGVANSRTSLSSINYSASTFFHFALIYLHEFGSKKADIHRHTDELPHHCYWNRVRLEQRAKLEKLFKNLGACDETGAGLRAELDEIGSNLANYSGNVEIHHAMETQKEKLIEAARHFHAATESEDIEHSYRRTLKEMEALFRMYHPHVEARKGTSEVYQKSAPNLASVINAVGKPASSSWGNRIRSSSAGVRSTGRHDVGQLASDDEDRVEESVLLDAGNAD